MLPSQCQCESIFTDYATSSQETPPPSVVHYPEKPICILYLCLLLFGHRKIFRYTVNFLRESSSKSGFDVILCIQPFMINFQVHGALEILSLSVIACGCGVKLKWQGAKFYFTHKRTLFKVRGFTPTSAHINC